MLAGPLDDYAAVIVPDGHGALNGIPDSADMAKALSCALANDRYFVTLCHGPACLLAPADDAGYPFKGHEICVFPDALEKHGIKVLDDDITGMVHRDRKLLTGDSPLASNALGRLAAEALLADYG